MKIISKISKIVPILLLVLGLQSCSNDDDTPPPPPTGPTLNIVETAAATADLSSLVTALQAADGDLVNVLSGNGPFTVLAPTNAAFDAFLSANGFASLGDVPTDVLSTILLNHVITGNVPSSALATAGSGYASTNATNADGDFLSLYFDASNGVSFNGISNVSTADVATTNGTVHIVDAVIGLPTVVTFATADSNFSSLVASLTAPGQPDFVSILSGQAGDPSPVQAPFTVFAPTNTAFQALLDSNPAWDTPADIDTALLTSVLLHHVVAPANVRSGDLTDGIAPLTAEGDAITINLPGNDGNPAKITDGSGVADIDIIAVDVQATNGVIHVVESVLIPNTTN